MTAALHTMDEVAEKLRTSRRWLQDFIKAHPYYRVAAGEADSLDAAMRAAEEMVARRRSEWSVLPRSWVQCGAVAAQSS